MRSNALRTDRPAVIVIGCDDVGSAIANALHRAGAAVVLIDAADPPWPRRGMSYTDAWYVGGATLDRVDACFCSSVKSLPAVLARGDMIAATTWSWEGAATALKPIAVIETREGCGAAIARCRPGALEGVLAVGVRTRRVAGWGADVVIAGAERAEDAGGAARSIEERSTGAVRIDAPHAGRFSTRHRIAERVEPGDVLGELGGFVAMAAASGVLKGLAARGARVAAGQTLVEIDPSGDADRCFGIAGDARAIAQRVGAAIRNATGMLRPPAAPPARVAIVA